MPDEQPSEFTAKIVAAYVRRNQVPPDQLGDLDLDRASSPRETR